jgi:hypothetical protein
MKGSIEELKENLIEVIDKIKEDDVTVTKIKRELKKYKILPGQVQLYFNDTHNKINEENDTELLYFLLEQIYEGTSKKYKGIDPTEYFTPREIKEIRTNFEGFVVDKVEFPYTFKKVLKGTEDDYTLYVKASELRLLFENGLLQYNPDTQREMRQRKDKETNEIIKTPKIHEKSVKDMEKLLEKGEMISTTITFNARQLSADEGVELNYNESEMTLTVEEGTLLDVLDGFHRTNAIVRALRRNPSLDTTFKLNILNFDKGRARQYFKQLNTTNPVGEGHLKSMDETRFAKHVATHLQYNSELKNKVSGSDHIAPNSDLLVTLNILIDSIEESFKVENKLEAIKLSKYLTKFINELFFTYPDEFFGDISSSKKNNIMTISSMFFGYMRLAKRMKDEGIPLEKLEAILKKIDFTKKNEKWMEYSVLDAELKSSKKIKSGIMEFFNDLDLKPYREGVINV